MNRIIVAVEACQKEITTGLANGEMTQSQVDFGSALLDVTNAEHVAILAQVKQMSEAGRINPRGNGNAPRVSWGQL
jgi:hypothetical protein